MQNIPTKNDVLDLLRHGTAEDRATFASRLPPNPFHDQVKLLIRSDNPGRVITALQACIYYYCEGADLAWGAVLAAAAHARAVELVQDASADHGLMPGTLSGLADSHCKALLRAGRSAELLNAADHYIKTFASLDDDSNVCQMKIRRAEALLNLKRVDEAEAALVDMRRVHPTAREEAQRLERIIDEWKVSITKVKGSGSNATTTINPARAPGIVTAIDQALARSPHLGAQSDIVVRHQIQQASIIFVGAPTKEEIERSLKSLQSSRGWAQKNDLITLENEALWGIYLCCSRLALYSDAADALIDLRKNLEAIRRNIANQKERGGVLASYPHLFGAMCEYLYKANRPADLLEAIEAFKGRAIADRLTEQTGAAVDDAAIYDRVRSLPVLARKEAFHYLTYFVDDERIYAVLVTKQGEIRKLDPILISRRNLQRLVENVEPLRWGKPRRDNPAVGIENLQVALAPLVAWLDEFVETGILNQGDHICCSTDDALHAVPLHYLRFRKALLIDAFSFSRVHSAFHLDHLLTARSSRAPDQYVGVAVSLHHERNDPAFIDGMQAPLRWLNDHCEGGVLIGAEATLARVKQVALNDCIVHFSTHGMFPDGPTSPFDDSYLLLADDQGLPTENRGGKLSPSAVSAADLDLSRSHVSVMACISGLARNGVAGDALGLDWAFIQAGAISLISTHWDINASTAGRFFVRFYENWIVQGLSRAAAHRAATLELLADDRSNQALNDWCGFSLTGDFR